MGKAFHVFRISAKSMTNEKLKQRVENLLEVNSEGNPTTESHELIASTTSLLSSVYGKESAQTENFRTELETIRNSNDKSYRKLTVNVTTLK